MKVFTLTCAALLLIGASSAAKIRRSEKRTTLADAKPTESLAEITEPDTDKKEKEVHKRGILHYGGALAAPGGLWPKTYASHYGYGLHLPAATSGLSVHPLSPAAHLHPPAVFKYNNGWQYRSLAGPSVLSGVSGLNANLPSYAGLSPAVTHFHQAATAQPFIIRPGGAVVQSYSVTYPHRKAAVAVRPAHAFASVAPVQHLHPVQPVAPAIQPIHNLHTLQHVQPLQPVAAVQPVQPVAVAEPAHHFQPVQHLHPVPPVQTVVQTSIVPPAPVPAIPDAPTFAFNPAQASFPAIPTFPNPPGFPTIPTVPSIPIQPSIPDVPAVPAVPNIPTIPSIPNFPQPQVPANGFFPVSIQPPLNQRPPAFGNVNPQGQFPGFGPVAGNNPDTGSADASPQIPVQPAPSPEPELPEPTQQPWKPVSYEPPSTVESPAGRPSHTLLPPYGNSPAEGYLPPAPSSQSGRLQQEYTIDSSYFDNLSDADIQQIFAQASLAAHRDHHHHTVHNYHTRY